MTNNSYLILHTPPGGSQTNISNAVNITEKDGIKATVDSFKFSVSGSYDDFFNDGDNIKIYFGTDSNLTLIIDGVIKSISLTINVDKKIWILTGQNRLEVLLNAPIPASYLTSGTNNTSAKIIKNLIGLANEKWLHAKYDATVTAELKSLGGNIDDTTNTLENIPSPGYFRKDTPLFQMIEELSVPKFTGVDVSAGNYIFYLDNSNNFHWEPKKTTLTDEINEGDFLEAGLEKTLFDVVNFVIIDAGRDFNGRPIKTYAYNVTGQTKGFRGKYIAKPEIAESLKKPDSITSDVPFGGEDIDGNTDNGTFRTKVRDAAKAEGQRIVDLFGQPRFKAKLLMKGTSGFVKGDLYTIVVGGFFRDVDDKVVDSINLRLTDIQHTFTSKGWTTQLEFKEDETTVTGTVSI